MAILLLVRHAQQDHRAGDLGLSEVGRRQAADFAHRLNAAQPTILYFSPLRRAVETAHIVASTVSCPMVVDDRLVERMDWSRVPNVPWDEFVVEWHRATADRDYTPMGGDSSRAAGKRLIDTCADAALRHPMGIVVIISHAGIITDALRTMFGDEFLLERKADLLERGVEHCSATILLWTPARRELFALGMR